MSEPVPAVVIVRLEFVAGVLQSRPCLDARPTPTVPIQWERCAEREDRRIQERKRVNPMMNEVPLQRFTHAMCSECAALEHVNQALKRLREVPT